MSNSGTHGAYDREQYEEALADIRRTLDTTEVVGWPKRNAELYELERLVRKYPAEARRLIGREGDPT